MNPEFSPLLTDLYQLNMLQAYLENGRTGTAVFEFFVRKLPERRGFLMAAGLEQAIDWLVQLRFSDEELAWLAGTGRFTPGLLDQLCRTHGAAGALLGGRALRHFLLSRRRGRRRRGGNRLDAGRMDRLRHRGTGRRRCRRGAGVALLDR